MQLYYHKTDGGAEYLMDTFIECENGHKEGTINEETKYLVRIDGDITKDAELTVREDEDTSERTYEYAFQKQLESIIKEYKKGDDESLDGDEVDKLIEHLRNRINLFEGNITQEEYEKFN